MPDPVDVLSQAGSLLADRLRSYQALSSWTIIFDRSSEEAATEDDGDTITIVCSSWDFDIATENWQTLHMPDFDLAIVAREGSSGALVRDARMAIGHIVGAVAQDRTFGGLFQDCQEVDVIDPQSNGVDANGTTLRLRLEFYTSREDWFTIVAP